MAQINFRLNFSTAVLNWSRVFAFAWKHQEVLTDLRKDPKGTIEEIAKGENGKYKADAKTAVQAGTIQSQSQNPIPNYSGYLPIPDTFAGLEKLSAEELKEFLLRGLTGVLRFDDQAELWADALHQAWTDQNLLIEIRKDPLGKLPHANQLQNTTYGIFPLPDRPKGLDKLEIDELEDFLSDQDDALHLAGIFPTAT